MKCNLYLCVCSIILIIIPVIVKCVQKKSVQLKNGDHSKPFVRELRKSDLPCYVELLNQLSVVGDVSKKQLNQFAAQVHYSDAHKVCVVEVNGEVCACATLLIEQKLLHGFKKVGHIEDVVTEKKSRLRGYGKMMVKYLTELGRQNGCYKVILDCNEGNIAFYEKCGLKQHGVQMSYYFE